MEADRRIDLLARQIDEARDGKPEDFEGWKERTRAALRVAMGEDHPATLRFEEIPFGLLVATTSTPQIDWDRARESGVHKAISLLEGCQHEIAASEPSSPSVAVEGLHPWIAGAVVGLWNDGHHRQAVDEATRAVEIRLKTRIGVDLTGAPLLTEAFNPDDPKPGQPRLRFQEYEARSKAGWWP